MSKPDWQTLTFDADGRPIPPERWLDWTLEWRMGWDSYMTGVAAKFPMYRDGKPTSYRHQRTSAYDAGRETARAWKRNEERVGR